MSFESNLSELLRPLKPKLAGGCWAKGERMDYLRMDLKVCEGCGALWVRPGAVLEVYCQHCAERLAEFPAARRRRGEDRVLESRRKGCAAATRNVDGDKGGAR